jgi:hypothetical protein
MRPFMPKGGHEGQGFPSTGTTPRAITDFANNNLAGWYTTSGDATEGFERLSNGTSKAPIIDPNDNLHSTAALGINNAGTIVGQYENVSGGVDTYHGFLLSPVMASCSRRAERSALTILAYPAYRPAFRRSTITAISRAISGAPRRLHKDSSTPAGVR